jgi:hypothetical protein
MLQENSSRKAQLELLITKKENHLYGKLTFFNNTGKDLWLEKRKVAYSGTILINCFVIKDINKNIFLEFTGPVARFTAPTEKDFIIVKPNQLYSSKFRLDDKYSFSNQPSTYSVQFISTMFPTNEQVSYKYESNVALIKY